MTCQFFFHFLLFSISRQPTVYAGIIIHQKHSHEDDLKCKKQRKFSELCAAVWACVKMKPLTVKQDLLNCPACCQDLTSLCILYFLLSHERWSLNKMALRKHVLDVSNHLLLGDKMLVETFFHIWLKSVTLWFSRCFSNDYNNRCNRYDTAWGL